MVTDLSERHFDTNFFPFDKNERNKLYGIWQQHKQLKTMEFSETWSDIYNDEGYRHSNLHLLKKVVAAVAKAPSYKISTNRTYLKWLHIPSKSAQK